MIIKDIVVKSEWEKDGEKKKKYHNAGVLFIDDKGGMFGSLKIFGHDIKFSIYDKKEKGKEENRIPGTTNLNEEDL
jgi:hypothetical protein